MAASTLPEGTDSIIDTDAVTEEMERTSIPMDNDAEALGMGVAGADSGSAPSFGGAPAADAAETAKEAFSDAKSQAGEKVSDLKGQATDKLRAFVDTGKGRATESINSLAKLVEDSAQTVDDKVGSQYGDYARQAASLLTGLATKIDEQDVEALLGTARDTVRKSPAIAIGAAAAIGFVLARVVKAGVDAVEVAASSASNDDRKA